MDQASNSLQLVSCESLHHKLQQCVLEHSCNCKKERNHRKTKTNPPFHFADLPRTEHKSWLPAIVFTIKTLLKQEGSKTADNTNDDEPEADKLPPCSDFMATQTAVLFKCDGVNVVVMPVNDWEPMGGYTALYKQCLSQPADAQIL